MRRTETSASSVYLDTIRGSAAMVVFLAHGRNIFFGNLRGQAAAPVSVNSAAVTPVAPVASSLAVPPALGIGHDAVMVFFVLSGYLVGSSVLRWMREGSWSWRRYLTQRLTRLWMVLIPALVIGYGLDAMGQHIFGNASLYGAPMGQAVISTPVAQNLSFVLALKNLAFVQTILGPMLGSNVALWSLSNEFWYYMLFPLTVILLRPASSRAARAVSLAILIALVWFIGAEKTLYFSIWMLGVAIGALPRMERRFSRPLIALSGLTFLAAGAYGRLHPFASQYAADLMLSLTACAVIYSCLQERQAIRPTVYSRTVQAAADMSYTLYLVHLPALVWISAALAGEWHAWPKDLPHLAAFGAILGAVLAYAFAVYYLFERNTNRVRAAVDGWRRREEKSQEAFA
jgi:peptidoglycan/LPS O-acetylase OafA/YrhL